MASRIIEGYKLYKDDAVSLDYYEDDHVIFKVKNKKNTDFYLVSMVYGYWNCDCADYQYRNKREEGSFYCKHLQAAQYKLLEILDKQNNSDV